MPSERERRALFDDLSVQSRSIHTRLVDGRRLGVEQSEETITESMLLDLARSQPRVVVRTFSRIEESRRTGGDWEWWWEGNSEWFGAIVQAKKLKVVGSSAGYDFGYRPRATESRPHPEAQIELLLRAARERQLPPLYVLYNGPELVLDPHTWDCSELPADPPELGASALPAAVALWLLGLNATGQQAVNDYARPLACLLCPEGCPGRAGPLRWLYGEPNPPLLGFADDTAADDQAFLAARSYLASVALARIGWFRRRSTRDAELDLVRSGVRSEAPEYVYASLEQQDLSADPDTAEDGARPPRLVVIRRPDGD